MDEQELSSRFSGAALSIPTLSGFTLIEVLVALLILGLSVLGYAALQGQALAMTQDTFWRAQAYDVAEQLAIVVHANPAQQNFFLRAINWQMPSSPLPLACVGRRVCSADQRLQADIDQLKTQALLQLPQAQIQVDRCAAGATQLCAKVAWSGNPVTSCETAGEGCLSLPLAVTAL